MEYSAVVIVSFCLLAIFWGMTYNEEPIAKKTKTPKIKIKGENKMEKKIKDLSFEEIQDYCHERMAETKKCLSCALNPICNFAQNNSIDGRKNMLVNKGIYKKEFLNQTIKFEQRCPKCGQKLR